MEAINDPSEPPGAKRSAGTLVVLAAGMGSRYGGLKQLEPMGPGGETILDYAVRDARAAGFGRAVFVIRRDFEAEFRERVVARYADRIETACAFQDLDDLPPGCPAPPAGRPKPWGTGHAAWAARRAVDEPCVVVNADDFYGAASYRALAGFLRSTRGAGGPPHRFAMVAFRLANTLSEHGAVARGICAVGADGRLVSVTECTGITPAPAGPPGAAQAPDFAGRGPARFTGAEPVSMNFWGFTPAVFPLLEAAFARFLATRGDDPRAEFYLPAAVATMVAAGDATVDVLPTPDRWFGVTYREDRPAVQAALAALAST